MAHFRAQHRSGGQLFPQTYGFEDTADQTGFDAGGPAYYAGADGNSFFSGGPASPPGSQGHYQPAHGTSNLIRWDQSRKITKNIFKM